MLMRPAERGFSIVVEYLLGNNANPNIVDHVRTNYLALDSVVVHCACHSRHLHTSADEAYSAYVLCSTVITNTIRRLDQNCNHFISYKQAYSFIKMKTGREEL